MYLCYFLSYKDTNRQSFLMKAKYDIKNPRNMFLKICHNQQYTFNSSLFRSKLATTMPRKAGRSRVTAASLLYKWQTGNLSVCL